MKDLSNVFKRSPRLLSLYRNGQLDTLIQQFQEIINQNHYLGGSKCSAFLMPDRKHVFKITIREIGYFKKGYCQKFMEQLQTDEKNPLIFFQNHINSLSQYFAPIKDIVYSDQNIFVYIQDYCQSLRVYKRSLLDGQCFKPEIIIEILKFIQYMIEHDILITEIGIANLGIFKNKPHCPKLIIFDYDTIKPLRQTMIRYPSRWWGFQLGNLLYYLSFVFQPTKIRWYYDHHHRWGKENYDFKSIEKDFPPCIISLLNCYTEETLNNNTEKKLENIIQKINLCIQEIAGKKW